MMKTGHIESTNQKTGTAEKWLLGLLFGLIMLAYRELLVWDLDLGSPLDTVGWFYDLSDTSPQFVFILVSILLYIRRRDIVRAYRKDRSSWPAVLFLLPCMCLFLWGHYVNAIDIVYISFLLAGFGSIRFLSGKELTRLILIPVLILVLAIPLPAVLVNQIVFPFQLWTAEHCAWLLNVIGIPSLPMGDVISMAESNVRVAESCTALGFLKWLTIFALAYVYIFPVSRLHAFLLVLSAPVIAYGVNLLRAFSLIFNPRLEVLSIHAVQGVAFFMIGFSLLYAMDNFLQRMIVIGEDSPVHKEPAGNHNDINSSTRQKRLLLLIALFLVMFIASIWLPRWQTPSADPAQEFGIPEVIGNWKMIDTLQPNYIFLGSTRYSSYLDRVYARNKDVVLVFIGYDDRLHRQRSLLSDKNAYHDEIGLIEDRSQIRLGNSDQFAVSVLTERIDHVRILSYQWYEGVNNVAMEILRAFLALDQSPFRRAGGAMVIRIATNVERSPQGRMLADKRLQDFLASMRSAKNKEPG